MTINNTKRVVVAMSGGVDSSVAAYLLKEEGYDVIGISLKLWDYSEPERKANSKTCCSFKDIRDAGDVCAALGVPFYAFNYKTHFEDNVVKPFVKAYHEGRTPNPCILCNQHVKFDRLLEEAEKLGADFLATGHYARVTSDSDGAYHLHKGKDPAKDQSYVLFGLSQKDLARVKFPIGGYTKDEIRDIARKFNLPTADKHESMDICFIPNNDYAAFIEKNYPMPHLKPGNFVDTKGNVLGQHKGIHAYTVGQRRGLSVAGEERFYVLKIDVEKNEVVLGVQEETLKEGCRVTRVSWVKEGIDLKKAFPSLVKIRYQKDEIPSLLESDASGEILVRFREKRPGVTPGQAAVFYENEEVIGGGWISEAF